MQNYICYSSVMISWIDLLSVETLNTARWTPLLLTWPFRVPRSSPWSKATCYSNTNMVWKDTTCRDCDRHCFPRTCCKAHAKHDRRTYIVSTRERVNQSNTKITADCLRNKAIKNKFIYRKRVKDRIVNKSKFSCKCISKKRVKLP